MDVLREVTGYVALALLGTYWAVAVLGTAPQLRKGVRDRELRLRVVVIRTAACVVGFLAVGVIHFWATQWWHAVVAAAGALLAGVVLRRAYRRLVAPPRHRITLGRRVLGRRALGVRALGGRQPRTGGSREPQHALEDRIPVPRGLPRAAMPGVPSSGVRGRSSVGRAQDR